MDGFDTNHRYGVDLRMFKKFKALFGAQDMTVGSPIKCLLMFSVPLLIGNLAQLLYSTVDSVIVGKYVGDEALASIGVDTPLLLLFLVIFMAIGSGVMVMVSQYFGAKDYENLERTVGNSITLIAAASVVLTVGGILLTPWMLRVINTPPETYEMAKIDLIICFYGIAGDGFYNIMSGILRGMGESVFPLLVLILTTVLNIVLDLWFVIGLGMGIAGAAWATSIAKTVSAIVCLIKVLSAKNVCNVKARHLKLDRDILGTICRLGIPNGIAQGIMFLATIVIQSMINKMGFLVTASITAVLRVDGFAVIPSQTFGMSAATFTGQNVGAGRLDRVKKGAKQVFLMCLVTSLVMITAMLIFGKWMMGLFTDTKEVIDMGYGFILTMLPGYLLMCIGQSFGGVIRGAGDSMGPMWIALVTNTVIRIPAMLLLVHFTRSEIYPAGNPKSSFIAIVIAMFINAVITLIYYRKGRWKDKAIV